MSNDKTIKRVLETFEMNLTKAIEAEAVPGTRDKHEVQVDDWVWQWARQHFGVEDPMMNLQKMIMDHINKMMEDRFSMDAYCGVYAPEQ